MALVRRPISASTWGVYEQVWQEWEALLESVQADAGDREACVFFFVGRAYGQGESSSGMSRNLSSLAFWFKVVSRMSNRQ